MKKLLLVLSVAILSLAGCSSMSNTEKSALAVGTFGLIAGAQFGAAQAVGGAIVGTLIGHSLGSSMDEEDKKKMAKACRDDKAVAWKNPDTNNEFSVSPVSTYKQDMSKAPEGLVKLIAKHRAKEDMASVKSETWTCRLVYTKARIHKKGEKEPKKLNEHINACEDPKTKQWYAVPKA